MARSCLAALILYLSVSVALADEPKPLWLTAEGRQPPRLYLFWQSGWTPLKSPSHIDAVRECPPDLFQYVVSSGVETGLPHQSMCPAPATHKTRWAYAKDEAGRKKIADAKPQWWTREEYAKRIADGAAGVKWAMEKTGAYGLAPYVCAKKIEGDYKKRLRFWAFYDHWDQYTTWYGPRPPTDPWEWIQFRPDYGQKHMWGFYKAADDGSRIYSACALSPFAKYLADLVKIGAQNGLRGVFVDNPGCHCTCHYCQKAWPRYLRERFSPAELKKHFGIERYEDAKLNSPPFEIETKRFWAWSMATLLAGLREAGESVCGKGNFYVCPNGSPIEFVPSSNGCDPVEWGRLNAFQLGVRENIRMHEGSEQRRLTQSLVFNATDDLILGHKMLRGLKASRAWSAPLRSHVFLGKDEGFYNLAAAETLAFDGCFCDTGARWLPCTGRKPFHAFYRAHESVLRSGEFVAEVGVLCMWNELYRDPADSVREVRLVTDWLSEARVLWDAIMHDNLSAETLAKYRVVFVPNVRMLDDDQVQALTAYARAGGSLVLSGDVGTAYRCGAKREAAAFANMCPVPTDGAAFTCAKCGEGAVAYCPRGFADVDVPAVYTGSDVRCEQPARSLIRETNRSVFLDCLNRAAGMSLSAILPPGPRAVRIAARWFEEGDSAVMTVHLANYDLAMHTAAQRYYRVLRAPSTLTPAANVRVVVPVPRGYEAAAVSWAELPETETRPLEFAALRDGVRFTVPRVKSYSVAVVSLKRGAANGQSVADARGRKTSAEGSLPAIERQGDASPTIAYAKEAPAALDHALHVAPGNPVIVSGTAGRDLEIRLDRPGQEKPDPAVWSPLRGFDVSAEADKGEVRCLRFWVISPSGKIAAAGAVPAEQSTRIKIPATETGLYALMTEGGLGSLAVSTNGRALMAAAQPLVYEEPPDRLYFHVPKGQKEIVLTTGGLDLKAHLKLFDASGALRFRRDDFNYHHRPDKIAVPDGQDGQVWSMTVSTDTPPNRRAGRRTQIELAPPLPGFVSPDAGRLVVME